MRTAAGYDAWLKEVQDALASINMPWGDWQKRWTFDFRREFDSGAAANEAAMKANQFWWHEQNKAIDQDCLKTKNCWLPREHQGVCQPRS